jgi:hypothetical protein
MPYSETYAFCEAYTSIGKKIHKNNPQMSMHETFDVPPPGIMDTSPNQSSFEVPTAYPTGNELAVQADKMKQNLNTEKLAAYNANIQSVLNNEDKAFFIDSRGGTGKSFLYKSSTKQLL